MNQVSRPVQILLGVVLVFAALWFTVLKGGDPAVEPAPAPAASTPVDAGGATAQSGPGKAVEAANNAAQQAGNAANAAAGGTTPAEKPAGTSPQASASGATTSGTVKPTTPGGAQASGRSASQQAADRVIESIGTDLKARRAVVVLVYQPGESVDELLKKRVRTEIDRRKGRVKVYLVKAGQVGRYDGLFRDLSLAQTPSTVVIAPDNSAKVLGGLVSTARIDRLTSSALLTAGK